MKDLEYYKKNAEEDYTTTPISVLRYISSLEEALKPKQVVRPAPGFIPSGDQFPERGVYSQQGASFDENLYPDGRDFPDN